MQGHSKFKADLISGKILENSEWAETHVSGGGGMGMGGTTVVEQVRSRVTRHRKIWVEADNGQQRDVNLEDSAFAGRAGHRASFITLRAKWGKKVHTVLSHNHTTGISTLEKGKISHAAHDSLGLFALLLFALMVAANIFLNYDRHDTQYFVLWFVLGTPLAIIYMITHACRKFALKRWPTRELEDLAGQPLPRDASVALA